MLRITASESGPTAKLKLEGKLLGPWVDELNRCILGATNHQLLLELDLASLSFVDESGARALVEWIGRGAKLTACSGYLAALLNLEKP